jgi:hypothetical protein
MTQTNIPINTNVQVNLPEEDAMSGWNGAIGIVTQKEGSLMFIEGDGFSLWADPTQIEPVDNPAANIDQQDCPTITLEGVECGWTGNVMRYALDGIDTENGYEWTCPECDSLLDWEGPDTDE